MTYTITFDLNGAEFSVSAEDVEGLTAAYSSFGGSPRLFKDKAEAAIKAFQNGHGPIPAKPTGTSEAVAGAGPAEWGNDGDGDSGSDAWNTDGPWKGPEKPQERQRTDPWDDEPVPASKPAQRRSVPSRGTPAPARQDPAGAYTDTDKYGREWTVGLPDAPNCDCGEPAARMKAKAGPNAKNPGKPYTVFKCAKGAPGGDWRSKCEYSQFPN